MHAPEILADLEASAVEVEVLAGLDAGAAPAPTHRTGGRHGKIVDLARVQVAHVAKVVRYFVGQHGGTLEAAARALDCNRVTLGSILALPSTLSITEPMLARIAAAVGATVEQLRAGDVVLPDDAPMTGPGPGRLIVRRGRRR